MYSLQTLRKKAYDVNHRIEKGYQRYHRNNAIYTNMMGEKFEGYNLRNLETGFLVWDCYNNDYDHLWQLRDVEEFLKGIYLEKGLKW